jgi:hypothetical protein
MTTKREKEVLPKINALKRQIKELESKYEKLRASLGYDELNGWKPDPRIETQYGWVHAWTYPLYTYLNANASPDVRNKAVAITKAIISQLTINAKYGISIPQEPKEVDDSFFIKQAKYFIHEYDKCDICGEDRISHQCHIIPRAEGGAYNFENFVTLCPLHHHLFDNHRLNQEEWAVLLRVIEKKMPSAIEYSKYVREKQLNEFWANSANTSPRNEINQISNE